MGPQAWDLCKKKFSIDCHYADICYNLISMKINCNVIFPFLGHFLPFVPIFRAYEVTSRSQFDKRVRVLPNITNNTGYRETRVVLIDLLAIKVGGTPN